MEDLTAVRKKATRRTALQEVACVLPANVAQSYVRKVNHTVAMENAQAVFAKRPLLSHRLQQLFPIKINVESIYALPRCPTVVIKDRHHSVPQRKPLAWFCKPINVETGFVAHPNLIVVIQNFVPSQKTTAVLVGAEKLLVHKKMPFVAA